MNMTKVATDNVINYIDMTRSDIMRKFRTSEGDTGSSPVQIALLSFDIFFLSEHLRLHSHDYHSKRGLLQKLSSRRKLIKYFRSQDPDQCAVLLRALGLRK